MEIYDELQRAYDFFNEQLFNKSLPSCIITLQRNPLSRGFFAAEQFVSSEDNKIFTHELALNPSYFSVSSTQKVLSTLVHEMTHLLCFLNKTEGKNGYHNKKWGALMEEIGLIPSDTGKKGGKKTGYSVTHYIDEDGAFSKASIKFCEKGFTIPWHDRFVSGYFDQTSLINSNIPLVENLTKIVFSETKKNHFSGDITKGLKSSHMSKNGKRIKYSCACSSVWGRGGLSFFCNNCNTDFKISE